MTSTHLRELTRWAATVTVDDIPEEVLTQARRCVLDLLGVTAAAVRDDDVARLIAAERAMGASGDARVLYRGDRFSVPVAARINAFASSLTELADNVSVHANEANIPLALAHGERHGSSGEDVLAAIVIGAEVARRLHDTYYGTKKAGAEFPIGMTSPLNTFGSALTAARLMGAGPDAMFDAANVSLNLIASALEVSVFAGAPIKPLLFSGWHASSGYAAASYALHGITAGDESLDAPNGGWLPGAAHEWDDAELTRDLGSRWELSRPDRKRHASCGFSQTALDSVLELTRGIDADAVERIDVGLFAFGAQTVGAPASAVVNSTAAKFNLRYLIACTLRSGGVVSVADTSEANIPGRLADPAFVALMDKVGVTADAAFGFDRRFASEVRVTLADGTERTAVLDDARGRGNNQMTEAELDEKFFTLAAPVLGDERAQRVRDLVSGMSGMDDVAVLVDGLIVEG